MVRSDPAVSVMAAGVAFVVAVVSLAAALQFGGCARSASDELEIGKPYTDKLRRAPGDGSNITLELRLQAGPGAYHVEAQADGWFSINFYATPEQWLGSVSLEEPAFRGEADIVLPDHCPVVVRLGGQEGRKTFTLTVTPSELAASDRGEPNDETASATSLVPGDRPVEAPAEALAGGKGVIAPGDADWYSITLDAGVYALARSLPGEPDIVLADPAGVTLGASSWQSLAAGRYLVRVLPSDQWAYVVSYWFGLLRAPAGTPAGTGGGPGGQGTAPDGGCTVDIWELLGLGDATYLAIGTCSGPDRWFDATSHARLKAAFAQATLPPDQAELIGVRDGEWSGYFLYAGEARTPVLEIRDDLILVNGGSNGKWVVDGDAVFRLPVDLWDLLQEQGRRLASEAGPTLTWGGQTYRLSPASYRYHEDPAETGLAELGEAGGRKLMCEARLLDSPSGQPIPAIYVDDGREGWLCYRLTKTVSGKVVEILREDPYNVVYRFRGADGVDYALPCAKAAPGVPKPGDELEVTSWWPNGPDPSSNLAWLQPVEDLGAGGD